LNAQRQWNLVGSIALDLAQHQLKAGIDARRLNPTLGTTSSYLYLEFPLPAQLQVAQTLQYFTTQQLQQAFPTFQNYSFFAQDEWRLSARVHFTFGFRIEDNPPPRNRHGLQVFWVSNADDPRRASLVRSDRLPAEIPIAIAPRSGIAITVRNNPGRETIIRAGAGLFYDVAENWIGYALANDPLATKMTTVRNVGLAALPSTIAGATAIAPTVPYSTVTGVPTVFREPRVIEQNVTLEQAIGQSQSLSLSYVGAWGRRLVLGEFLQNLVPEVTITRVQQSTGTSDYNALQMKFQRKFRGGLNLRASYVWSHSIDVGSDAAGGGVVTATNYYAPPARGDSDFDVRQGAVVGWTYDLPRLDVLPVLVTLFRNVGVDGAVTYRTAVPVTVSSGSSGSWGQFPNLNAGVPVWIQDLNVAGGERLNPAAFTLLPNGAPGDLGRNVFRGFSFRQADVGVRRNFQIDEKLSIQLRIDAFNLLNTPNFASPQGRLERSPFGYSTMMLSTGLAGGSAGGLNAIYQPGGLRSLQLSFRVKF
jgi:hypothetical protein